MKALALVSAAAALAAAPAAAEYSGNVVRIGVLNDMSGIYSDFQGPGSVLAARMAVEDFGGKVDGVPIEVVFADHQNKADIGATAARQWLEKDGVDVIVDVPNSAIALAVNDIVRDHNAVFLVSGGGTDLLTGAKCTPNTVHWVYDTWANANSVTKAALRTGLKSWYFLTADYAFGHALEKQGIRSIEQDGGKVLGTARHPIGNQDFSSFLLQAQASGASAIALANAGGDTTNAIKQAAEFGLGKGKEKVIALTFQVNTVKALGLEAAQGIQTVSPFYWDQNDNTRAWSRRYQQRDAKGSMPNEMQAGVYSAVTHYLKAVQALGGDGDGKAVVGKMKETPTSDPLYGQGQIRIDGRKTHPMYLIEVKTPAESKEPWDYFKVVAALPAEEAFRPLAEGNCPLAATR